MKVSVYCNAAIYQGKAGIIGILHDGKNKKRVYDQFKNSNEDLAVQAAIIRTLRGLRFINKPQNTDVTIYLPRKIQLNHPKLKELLRQLKSYTVKINPKLIKIKAIAAQKLTEKTDKQKTSAPHKKIMSYVNNLISRGYEVEVNFSRNTEEYTEAEIEIYDRQSKKLLCAQEVIADTKGYEIQGCYRCPLPSQCPFYGRPYCTEQNIY